MKFKKDNLDYDRIRAVEWLLGYSGDAPGDWRFQNWNHSKRRLHSPFRMFLGEIERFSLDLNPRFDVPDAGPEDVRQTLLSEIGEHNRLQDLLYMALERGTTTGAVYLFSRPDPECYYRIYLYDECEVEPLPPEAGYGPGWMVQSFDGKRFNRSAYTDRAYLDFVPSKQAESPWVLASEQPHPYGRVPGVQILNKVQDHSFHPIPTFDWLSVEIATELCAQLLASSANYVYFGGPFIISSSPEQTLEELLERRQVLSGSTDAGMQSTELLQAAAMPPDHGEHLKRLTQNFCAHLGISWVPDTPPGDTSSLTLRLLHSKTYNSAQSYAHSYLDQGFKELFEQILAQATLDGVLAAISTELVVSYELEAFPPTISEKSQVLGLVEQLISLGIKADIALQEYFTNLEPAEIQQLMIGV